MPETSEKPCFLTAQPLILLQQIYAITFTDIKKLMRSPSELLTRLIQPVIWLTIYGQAMANIRVIPSGSLSYLDFVAPGIMAQSILFVSIFYGISLISERDFGILYKIMVTPASRTILVLGRAAAAALRAIPQMIMIYPLAYFLNVHLRWDFGALIGVLITIMLGGAVFSTFSLIIATLVKKRERFLGIGQAMALPFFFASNALYPIAIMPNWLKTFSHFNPLSYQVDALRSLMIVDQVSHFGLWTDFAVGIFVFIITVIIASKLYPRILY